MRKRTLLLTVTLAMASSITAIQANMETMTETAITAIPEPVPSPRDVFGTLNDKKVPLPNLQYIIKDKNAAIRLGKALFWDVAVGSDGQACASCHFQSGADPRITNQLSPGFNDKRDNGERDFDSNGVDGDQHFGGLASGIVRNFDRSPSHTAFLTASGQDAKPNIRLMPDDFPLHQLSNKHDRNSDIIYTTNDVISSMGTFGGIFNKTNVNSSDDDCQAGSSDFFHTNGLANRNVEPRHTPTTVNAVYNFRNFWDGRANNIFNGVSVFGRRDIQNDPRARVLVADQPYPYSLKLEKLELENSSLASQAMGPPMNNFEMSCKNRTFADIGRKVLSARPLAQQKVAYDDSVLGSLANKNSGLDTTYFDMVKDAFTNKFYRKRGYFTVDAEGQIHEDDNGFSHPELNFSLFFGVAVMMYESTLINNDDESSFGRFMAGNDHALTHKEKKGLDIFMGKGKCSSCHSGPTLSKAALHLQPEAEEGGLLERMLMADNETSQKPALYDNAFYNIGVTPTVADIGVGGTDPYGIPFSFTRQFLDDFSGKRHKADAFKVDPCSFDVRLNADMSPCDADEQLARLKADETRVAVDGAFKVPNLLNVGLTPPYFHNGSMATLEQLVDFYNRGGNRRDPKHDNNDTTGTGRLGQDDPNKRHPVGSNLDPDIQSLGLSDDEKSQLIAFLLSLTDERLRCDQAPFDHPSIKVPNGHGDVDDDNDGKADTIFAHIHEVGRKGVSSSQCVPNTGNLFDMQLRLKQVRHDH